MLGGGNETEHLPAFFDINIGIVHKKSKCVPFFPMPSAAHYKQYYEAMTTASCSASTVHVLCVIVFCRLCMCTWKTHVDCTGMEQQ